MRIELLARMRSSLWGSWRCTHGHRTSSKKQRLLGRTGLGGSPGKSLEQARDMLRKRVHLGSEDTGIVGSSARCVAGVELPAVSPSAVRSSADFWTCPWLVVQFEGQREPMWSVLGGSSGGMGLTQVVGREQECGRVCSVMQGGTSTADRGKKSARKRRDDKSLREAAASVWPRMVGDGRLAPIIRRAAAESAVRNWV